jgi:cytochrome c oxidase subunit 1
VLVPGLQLFADQRTFHAFVTGSGLIMVFYVVIPAMIGGFGSWFVPLMIGAPGMAFPRLSELSFWLLPLSLTLLLFALFVTGDGAAARSSLVALSGASEPGRAMGIAVLALHVAALSAMLTAINFITTIFNMRGPRMSLVDLPHFVWALLVTSFLLLLWLPVLAGVIAMLSTDRSFGPALLAAPQGGEPLLDQHLFWFFGHPETYVLLLPAFGIISQIIAGFSRRPVAGGLVTPALLVGLGFLGFVVWADQVYARGLTDTGFYVVTAGLIVAIPTVLMIAAWFLTMWRGTVRFRTPMLWALGFVFLFTVGGLTGIVRATATVEPAPADSYYVLAHFHYVLSLGAVFAIFAAWYYWFPKISGYLYNETLANLHFWTVFVGVNLTFFPPHFLGLAGLLRRYFGYPEGYDGWNHIAAVGAYIPILGVGIFLVCMGEALVRRRVAGKNPWKATTLEWKSAAPLLQPAP